MKPIICIPSRMASTRLPNKPLTIIKGKPLIQHCIEQLDYVNCQKYVITDSQNIADIALNNRRVCAYIERYKHRSGSDACAEYCAYADLPDDQIIINVQGDHYYIEDPQYIIEQLISALLFSDADISVVVTKDSKPGGVHVVLGERNSVLYFSRSPIPAVKDPNYQATYWKHLGIYCYTVKSLRRFTTLDSPSLEIIEGLEQLRFLHYGMKIQARVITNRVITIDTPENLARL